LPEGKVTGFTSALCYAKCCESEQINPNCISPICNKLPVLIR